jgi:hypothetical protein
MDANRHRDWLAWEVQALLRDATQVDAAENAEDAHGSGDDGVWRAMDASRSARSQWTSRAPAHGAG